MPAPPEPRLVGGVWCGQILEGLPDYLADELSAAQELAVEAHLRGCDWCANFGGRYSELVKAAQSVLGPCPAAAAGVVERLQANLDRELG